MSEIRRPLAGLTMNLSISESDDSADRGFPAAQVNRVTLDIVSALFGQGASLIFGHDWREDGVMEAVHGFAQQVQAPVQLTPNQTVLRGQPLLRNFLPWPDKPRLSQSDIERISSTLGVEQSGLPEGLLQYQEEAKGLDSTSPLFQYLRARGLTHLRRRLTAESHARLCIGGRKSGSEGRYPGIVEEALVSLESDRPLFLAGILGGAAHQLIQALMDKPMPEDFCLPTELSRLYSDPPVHERIDGTEDITVEPETVWTKFCALGIDGFASNNGLSVEENRRLFETTVLDEVIQIVLVGMGRIESRGRAKRIIQ